MSDRDGERGAVEDRPGRTPAEWTTFIVSSVILAVVVALIVGQMLSTTDPAAPRAEVGRIEAVGNRFRVHVTVVNDGDETAAGVQVTATLEPGDTGADSGGSATETGDLSVDFLAGGETEELVFLFDADPDAGRLTVAVTGYSDP